MDNKSFKEFTNLLIEEFYKSHQQYQIDTEKCRQGKIRHVVSNADNINKLILQWSNDLDEESINEAFNLALDSVEQVDVNCHAHIESLFYFGCIRYEQTPSPSMWSLKRILG